MAKRKKEQIEEDNKNNIERIQNMNTIEDMLWWKDLYDPNNIFTVESINKDKIKNLEWGAKADVLFSFLGVYVIGMYVYYPMEYRRTNYQIHICDSNEYNLEGSIYNFNKIKRINEDREKCKELNENESLKKFIKKYFSIGNVIPIWPGGNTDRGKAGVFDILNIYCNKDDNAYWMKTLVERYNNTFLEFVFNEEEEFEINKNIVKLSYCSTPEFLDSFENLNEKNRISLYNLWLKKIVNVIEDREKKLMDWIEQNKDRVEKFIK